MDASCVLTLRNERGREHRVHICRNDGRPQGLVYTKRFDLVVMNGGQGDLPTEEGLAQAVAKVGRVVAVNERQRQQQALVADLLPHAERLRQFAGSVDRRLR
jgi:protein-L-isoaspartate O-methyltransferase